MHRKRWKDEEAETTYHCMSRICGGERLLGGGEKEVFRSMLWQVAEFSGIQILTYAVLNNHFHALVRVPARGAVVSDDEIVRRYGLLYGSRDPRAEWHDHPSPEVLAQILASGGVEAERWRARLQRRMNDLSAFMKALKQRFSVWYNRKHGRIGTLWADRFKSVIVEDSHRALTTVAAYIDLNAVRAGVVEDPANYRWCGYGEAMGGGQRARAGLEQLYGDLRRGWTEVVSGYRQLLFGVGSAGRPGAGSLSREAALSVIERGGRVSLAEVLRCRVRYFSDGAVLGSSAFVESWFQASRDRLLLSSRRRDGPRPMTGAQWGNLAVYRDLQRRVFS